MRWISDPDRWSCYAATRLIGLLVEAICILKLNREVHGGYIALPLELIVATHQRASIRSRKGVRREWNYNGLGYIATVKTKIRFVCFATIDTAADECLSLIHI